MLRDGSITTSDECEQASCAGGEVAGAATHDDRCDRIHRRLQRIVKARGALDIEEAAALRDAQAAMIWRRYGYGSLLEYMELEMGYSPRAAIERLRVAHAIVDLPQMAAAMEQGELSFSAARELTRVATAETEGEWLEATTEMNLREIEEKVSGHKRGDRPGDRPDPSLRKRPWRLELTPEAFALLRQVQAVIDKERGERLDDSGLIEALARRYLDGGGAESDRAPYQIAVTQCRDCKRGWQDGGGITVEMSPAAVERALCDAQEIGSIDSDEITRAKQAIPPALRRKVKRRDQGRCQVPGCRASRNCDIHHLIPRAKGGPNTLANLTTLCESHHLAHHEGALSITRVNGELKCTRTGSNNFALAQRAVETASALKSLGFRREEIAAATAKTKTHVGNSDLTLDQWIRIALGYCPKAATG